MFNKFQLPPFIRDSILIGIFVFLWQLNARVAAIETTQQLMLAGKVKLSAEIVSAEIGRN